MKREVAAATVAFAVALAVFAFTRRRAAEAPGGAARRVISLSPSITEMVFAMGAGDRVVGVSKGVTWPPEAEKAPRVGGYADVDLERLVGLRPDLVLIQGIHAPAHDQATELGIRVVRIRMDTLAEIKAAAREMAGLLGMPEAGHALAERIEGGLDEVRARARGRRRLRTFLHISHGLALPGPTPLTTGGGTFLTELLEIAGGENVFAESSRPYVPVLAEAIIQRDPEVVMVSAPGAELTPEGTEAVRARWREMLAASRSPGGPRVRVVFLTVECAQIPGPRVGEIAREMEKLLWRTENSDRR